jgi:hypothetical protein
VRRGPGVVDRVRERRTPSPHRLTGRPTHRTRRPGLRAR